MNTAEDFIILQEHVYQHNKKNLTIGLSKPAKLKNSRYFLNTPRIRDMPYNIKESISFGLSVMSCMDLVLFSFTVSLKY